MSKVLVVSPIAGTTASDRKVLNAVDTTTAAPTTNLEGVFLNRIEYLHLFFKLTNSDTANPATFYVQLWWWNPITDMWHIGERLKVNNNDVHTIEVQGLNRVYLQVDQIVYGGSTTTPTLDGWLGMVVPV